MKILVTGGARFIGSHLSKALIERGDNVVIIDNFNDFYDPKLKRDRISKFLKGCKFTLYEGDIRDYQFLETIFKKEKLDKVMHLAAVAGVRHSLIDPFVYEEVNVRGTLNLLELSVKYKIQNFIFASSSSVYGLSKEAIFSEHHCVDFPISMYAAYKRAKELMAHVYSHIHGLNTVGLRYFSVYGPWGRPDMALFKFTKNILEDKPIDVYNYGKMSRSFTYIDDIVTGTLKAIDQNFKYEIINIGGAKEEQLMRYIKLIEKYLGKKAKKNLMPMQPGDIHVSMADSRKLSKLDWNPKTSIDEGIKHFINWYKNYYNVGDQEEAEAEQTASV